MSALPLPTSPSPMAPSATQDALVKDGTSQSFIKDVVEGSQDKIVLVDLWAPWCGPCKQLGPLLEKIVQQHRGKVQLVKINIDQHPQIAQSLRVQSIPAVYAFYRGQPVDGFVGALPESQLKAFVDGVVALAGGAGTEESVNLASLLQQAEAFLAEERLGEAAARFAEVLQAEPENSHAYMGFVRVALAMHNLDQVRELMGNAPEKVRQEKEWVTLQTAFALAQKVVNAAPLDQLKVVVEAEPKNHQARYDYALALYAAGEVEPAMEALLAIIRQDRKWNEEAARKELVNMFDALGGAHPLTQQGRRKLSAILFP